MATEDNMADLDLPNELDMLKQRAKMLGIAFSNNIGVDALRARINEKLGTDDDEPAETEEVEEEPVTEEVIEPAPVVEAVTEAVAEPVPTPMSPQVITNALTSHPAKIPVRETKPKKLSLRQHMLNEQMKLVRCRITNMDPKKKDLEGEVITVANEYLGVVKKFIPFGEVTDDGFHIPFCLYTELKDREFLHIRTVTHPVTKQITTKTSMAREYSIEVLTPLTREELTRLATAQIAAGSLDG